MCVCFRFVYCFLCPPWKRGHIVLQLLVGMSVCRSVDQVLSAQYVLTPSLDQYQTWCRGSPNWVDDPYWFSGHLFKGQGQTTVLSTLYILTSCLLASDRFCLYREDKPELYTMGGIYVSETFLVYNFKDHFELEKNGIFVKENFIFET